MFRKLFAVLALIVSLTACSSTPEAAPAPEPAAVVATDAAEVLWPAVDNQYAALVQCNHFLPIGADRDACTTSALQSFPAIAACVEEDSNGPCYWDATTRSNGQGDSFTVDGSNVVTYVSAAL